MPALGSVHYHVRTSGHRSLLLPLRLSDRMLPLSPLWEELASWRGDGAWLRNIVASTAVMEKRAKQDAEVFSASQLVGLNSCTKALIGTEGLAER